MSQKTPRLCHDCKKKLIYPLINRCDECNHKHLAKKCKICGKEIGYRKIRCDDCNTNKINEDLIKKREYSRKYSVDYYQKHKGDIHFKERRREFIKRYMVERINKDINFKIACRLRCLIYQALKRYSLGGKLNKSIKYGIDFDKIIPYLITILPKDFKESKYHIDHIRPLCSFNLNNLEEIEKAFDVKNLQWLTATENIIKGGKWLEK